jgi:hypothetical protein
LPELTPVLLKKLRLLTLVTFAGRSKVNNTSEEEGKNDFNDSESESEAQETSFFSRAKNPSKRNNDVIVTIDIKV